MRFLSLSRALCVGVLLVGGATLLSAQAAHAQITFTLTNFTAPPTTPNSEAYFYGTITNTGSTTIYLNGLTLSQNTGTTPATGVFTQDTNPFYNTAPLFLTASGSGTTSTYTGQLFGIKMSALYNAITAKYFGTATLTGGTTDSSNSTLGTPQNFAVASAAPEPSAFALVGLGLAGIPVLRRRIKNSAA